MLFSIDYYVYLSLIFFFQTGRIKSLQSVRLSSSLFRISFSANTNLYKVSITSQNLSDNQNSLELDSTVISTAGTTNTAGTTGTLFDGSPVVNEPQSNFIAPAKNPRVYTPKIQSINSNMSKSNAKPTKTPIKTNYQGVKSDPNTVALLNPQLLIRYKLPRAKTLMKLQLDELQSMYKAQSEATARDRPPSSNYSPSQRDPFMDNFTQTYTSPDAKKGAIRGKPTSSKDSDRKGADDSGNGEYSKSRGQKIRTNSAMDESEIYSESDEIRREYDLISIAPTELEEDYYGDEENISLSSVSSASLMSMVQEGLTLEEMQQNLYTEYGVKANINALRRRIQEDENEKKMKKRTGKTRREKQKKRNAKRMDKVDNRIHLPLHSQFIQVKELANLMEVGAGEVVKHLMMSMGMMVTMTQNIDIPTAKQIIAAFGKEFAEDEADDVDEDDEDSEEGEIIHDASIEFINRAPIVTIMGHVDHGKTSLLDRIRQTRVALGEAGGITQGISAFHVKTAGEREITFIDTPGHSAFSEMRKRGANVTDVVILVVAADDGIMEQTKECIAAANAARCPLIVAINKIDKEGADPKIVKSSLMNYGVLIEDYGGETQCVEVSAKTGFGIDDLLEKISLQAEIMNLKAAKNVPAQGSVIEARIDKGLGVVVSALVLKGTLKIGDLVLAGPSWGKVRRILSDQNKEIKEAGPSMPVQIVGMNAVPNAGDVLTVTTNEGDARDVAEARQRIAKQSQGSASAAAVFAQASGIIDGTIGSKEIMKVPVIIKADVAGSVEAMRSSIEAIEESDEEAICKVDVVYAGVGDVTSSDVAIAAVAKAKVIAFNVAAAANAIEEARASNVMINYYSVVYDLLNELEKKVKLTLAPPPPGVLIGTAEVKKTFKIGRGGKVAGCIVLDGVIKADSKIRILRGKRNPIHTGVITSLKVVKDDAVEVPVGSDCGMSFKDFTEFEEGDLIECFVSNADDSKEA